MDVNLQLIGNTGFNITTGSGHEIITDAGPDFNGENQGARPMELLLSGLGGCSGIDVVHILRKSNQTVDDMRIHIHATRAETDPKVFTNIVISYHLKGDNLDAKKVDRAIKLSEEKYCSASIMLGKTATIEHRFSINGI